MSVCEQNKQRVLQFFLDVLNDGRLELIDDLVAKDFIGRLTCVGAAITGPDGMRRFVSHRRATRPDLYVQVEDQIAEDDRVATRWRATAFPTAASASSPAALACRGITIIRLLAGKQVDAYTQCASRPIARLNAPDESPKRT
jgi:predicted ester cyclase